mgnify:CR=1 FL=1
MDSALSKAIDQPDVDHVLLLAVSHADTTIKKYIWRGFRPSRGGQTELMVGDKSAQDFVLEALRRLCEGIRKYDPTKTLYENINSATDSLIWSDKKSSDRTGIIDYAETKSDEGPASDPLSTAASPELSASETVLDKELLDAQRGCFKTIRSAFDGDPEMQNYLDALSEGFSKPGEIADLTNIPVNKVYELRRKLIKFAPRFFGVDGYQGLALQLLEGK